MEPSFFNAEHLSGTYFDGTWQTSETVRPVCEPATGNRIADLGLASPANVEECALRARKVQRTWDCVSPDERAAVLLRAVAVATLHAAEIADWLVRESGSVRAKAAFEVQITLKAMQLAAAMPHQAQGLVLPATQGTMSLARRRPIGVVGVISPFNFPLYLAMRAIAPAIAVGNAVLLKPDPRTGICGGHVIARIFELAGLPSGVLQVLPGGVEVGEALCGHAEVGMIQFTGSTNAGRAVGQAAGRALKKVSLELGGKNPLVILEDADLDLAVRNAAWAAFLHQGQICMSAGRILVQERIAAAFHERLAAKAKALPVGDPAIGEVAIGPIIDSQQLRHVQRIVDASVAAGAQLLAGGTAEGLLHAPTVLAGVRPGMAAFEEEIFGPVASVTTFGCDEEAIALATQTSHGLSGGVISPNVARAMAIGERLHVGLLHINDQTVNDDVVNPFGGFGTSGNGSAIGGSANWEAFTDWQWTTIKSAPPAYPF